MKRSGFISRADLLQTLRAVDDETREAAADLLGYVAQPRAKSAPDMPFTPAAEPRASEELSIPEPADVSRPLVPALFWRLEKYAARQKEGSTTAPPRKLPAWKNRPGRPPPIFWLENWRSLAPRLLTALRGSGPGLDYDVERAVKILARGESLTQLPRKERPKPLPRVQVVFDRSSHLIPYWLDQDLVAATLATILGEHNTETAFAQESADELILGHIEEGAPYRLPPAGSAVLVLGDLGCLSPSAYRENSWARFGRRVRAAGCHPIALVPAPAGLVAASCRRAWRLIPWGLERGEVMLNRDIRQKRARRLLALVSHAFRIEPGLLRAARLVLGREAGDVGVEAEAWAELKRRHPSAGTMAPELAEELQQQFAKEPRRIRKEVLACQCEWRQSVAGEIWFDEIINLPPASQALLPNPDDVKQSRSFFAYAAGSFPPDSEIGLKITSWLANEVARRSTDNAWTIAEYARAIYIAKKDDPDFELPGNVDPAHIQGPQVLSGPLSFRFGRDCLEVLTGAADHSGAAHLGMMPCENGILNHSVVPDQRPDPALFWSDGKAPSWASGWGEDEFGPYAEFTVGDVVQRLRWCPAGRFMMGSPTTEAGRYNDEGPQHEVSLDTGYWMMDTPVRQCLWQAVMGKNPSRFKSPDRPVENVDYKMIEQFLSRLNKRLPDLNLSLPSEAQWEYACRAGSKAATYAGDLEILGERNAPVLDRIAWYGGNSGVGFELADGEDSSGWDEKQYPDSPSGTHLVGQKRPNDLGLYDMLGNVWEWCADHWHDNYDGAPADGSAWRDDDAAAVRVMRGGSWGDRAGDVRAACRDHNPPTNRYVFVGFRCVRVQLSDKREAAPVDRGAAQQAERRAAARSTGDAVPAICLTPETASASIHLPPAGRIRIISDSAELEFAQAGRPPWASHMGCDTHGLFVEFTVGSVVQRLRWIPPGHFTMGSPKGEVGGWGDREGPQHEVTLATGFWMMDTPTRQDLWQAVMDDNPSRFKSPDRPVESIDFDAAEQFVKRLNERSPGLDLALPSEAQWEYACRAGSTTATYAGDLEILGERNAPVLDRIAWYGGNSGVGFELENGSDSSDWKEVQYPNPRSGTHPVGQKAPNDFGLHDMLGNVWEWCADHWHENYEGAPTDGSTWQDKRAAAGRVWRGGSWADLAGAVRAACRDHYPPTYRFGGVGFRCVRVQNPAEKKGRR